MKRPLDTFNLQFFFIFVLFSFVIFTTFLTMREKKLREKEILLFTYFFFTETNNLTF